MPNPSLLLSSFQKYKNYIIGAGAVGGVAATPEDSEASYVGIKANGFDKLKGKFSSVIDRGVRAEVSDIGAATLRNLNDIPKYGTTLGRVFEHKELYELYPELKNVKIRHDPDKNYSIFDKLENEIVIGSKDAPGIHDAYESEILHEVQHWIQHKEGWGLGSSIKDSPEMKKAGILNVSRKAHTQAAKLQDLMQDMGMNRKLLSLTPSLQMTDISNLYKKAYGENLSGGAINLAMRNDSKTISNKINELSSNIHKLEMEAEYNYKRHSGEWEARNTQRHYADELLGNKFQPYDTVASDFTPDMNDFLVKTYGTQYKSLPQKDYIAHLQSKMNSLDGLSDNKVVRGYQEKQALDSTLKTVRMGREQGLVSSALDPAEILTAVATGGAGTFGLKGLNIGSRALAGAVETGIGVGMNRWEDRDE